MPQQKHRRRWRRKGSCCLTPPRPCIDSMPRRCMPHCAACPPCPSAQRIAPSSSSHSECSCEEEKYCTVDSCKNAPQCVTAKLRYCPYGFKNKPGTDLSPEQPRSKEMLDYQPSQEGVMRAQYPQTASIPYMRTQAQPSGYPAVPTMSSMHSRAPEPFDQSMPQYAQQFPPEAAQAPIKQDFGPPEFQAPMQAMMPTSPDYLAPMPGRMMSISPEPQSQMQQTMIPSPVSVPSPLSYTSGPSIQIRHPPDQYQPYYSEPQDTMPSYDYPAPLRPIPVSQEEGYVNIPRAEKQGGGYSPAQYSLGPAPEDSMYTSGLPPQYDPGKFALSAVPSPERMKPRSIIIQEEPRGMPQYISATENAPTDRPPASAPRGKHGLIYDTKVQQPVSDTSYIRYISESPTSPAPSERIPGSRPVSTEGPSRTMYRPPFQADTSMGMPYQPDTSRTDPYQPDIDKTGPYQPDTGWTGPYQPDTGRTGPYQPDTGRTGPYHPDTGRTGPYQPDTGRTGPYQPDTGRTGPYQPDTGRTGPYQPDTGRTGPFQPDTGRTGPYQPDTGRTGPYQPDTGRTGPYTPDTARGVPYQPDARVVPSIVAESVPRKAVHHALPEASYDTQLPMQPSAPDRDDTHSVMLDRPRRSQPMLGGYNSMVESPPPTGQSFSSRYPIGRPLAESTSIGSSRKVPRDYSGGQPLSPATSVRVSEHLSSGTDGLHKISYRGPSTGYNKFCKEPPQPEQVDRSSGYEYPVPQSDLEAQEETQPKCSCRYPPAFKHLECAGLMSGNCECNEKDL